MEQLATLRATVTLSERMLSAARAYNWDELQRLEAEERRLIDRFQLESAGSTEDIGIRRQLLQTILDNHATIAEIAQPLRDDIKIFLDTLAKAAGTEK